MSYYTISLPVSSKIDTRSPLLVTPDSPKQFRQYVEKFARYFLREMRTDGIQFEASETVESVGYVPYEAYLFHDLAHDLPDEDSSPKQRCFGACCFRWREYEKAPPEWSLDWIWLHPFRRKRGVLRDVWPLFEQKYGQFYIETSYSAAMEKFLSKARAAKSNNKN